MAVNKESVCFVWNGAAGATANAGGATKEAYDANSATDFMEADGDAIGGIANTFTGSPCEIFSNGSGMNVEVRDIGSNLWWTDVIDGTVAFLNATDTVSYPVGYYEIIEHGDDYVVLNLDYNPDQTSNSCGIAVGGAFDTIQNSSDADIMNATTYTRTCYVRGDVEQTVGITISSGGVSTNTWKQFIGVDETWTRLPVGQYIKYDSSETNLGTHGFVISVPGVYMYGFAQIKPNGAAENPIYRNFSAAGVGTGGVFDNCYANFGYNCFEFRGHCTNCVAMHPRVYGFSMATHGCSIRRCLAIAGAHASTSSGAYVGGAGCSADHSIFVGFNMGIINYGGAYYYMLSSCTFIGCLSQCVRMAVTSGTNISIRNNLFIDNGAGGVAIYSAGQPYDEDYNVCDHSFANSGFKGTNSYYGIDLSDVITDINNYDYSINTNSAIAQQYIIGKGEPIAEYNNNPSA